MDYKIHRLKQENEIPGVFTPNKIMNNENLK